MLQCLRIRKMSRPRVAVVDIGLGNAATIIQMLRNLEVMAEPVIEARDVKSFEKLILPGVGSWEKGVLALDESGWREEICKHVQNERPLLGVCLGFQLLFESSDEGLGEGLGFLPGRVRKISDILDKIETNVGWMEVSNQRAPLGLQAERYYFSHQFCVPAATVRNFYHEIVIERPEITAIASSGCVVGAQFHPERSLKYGFNFLDRFARDKH